MVMVFTLFIVTYAHSIRQNPNNMIVFEKKKNNQKIRNLSCSFIKLKTRLLEHWNYYLQSLFKLPCPNSPIHHHICVYINIFFYCFEIFNGTYSMSFSWHLFTKQLDEFRLEIQRRDQEILAMAAKMKTLEEQHQVGVSFVRTVGKNVLNVGLCWMWFFYRIISATLPFWKNHFAPRRNTTLWCRPTSKSCAHDWRRKIASLKRKRRPLFRPSRNAIEWPMNWLNSKITWISRIERSVCCRERYVTRIAVIFELISTRHKKIVEHVTQRRRGLFTSAFIVVLIRETGLPTFFS